MALLQCNFFSEALGMPSTMNVILPENKHISKYKTLYLLHGYRNDFSSWQRQTSIERYSNDYNLAIIMPNVNNSFYCNYYGINNGYKYWDFISDEIIRVSRKFFNISNLREDTFVGGFSMGGFGAYKLAFNRPETFSVAISLSGALDAKNISNVTKIDEREVENIIGDISNIDKSENDLFYRAKKINENKKLPKLYQYCGKNDFLYDDNIKFKNHIKNLNFDCTYVEDEGTHSWQYWDTQIKKVLEWLPLE